MDLLLTIDARSVEAPARRTIDVGRTSPNPRRRNRGPVRPPLTHARQGVLPGMARPREPASGLASVVAVQGRNHLRRAPIAKSAVDTAYAGAPLLAVVTRTPRRTAALAAAAPGAMTARNPRAYRPLSTVRTVVAKHQTFTGATLRIPRPSHRSLDIPKPLVSARARLTPDKLVPSAVRSRA